VSTALEGAVGSYDTVVTRLECPSKRSSRLTVRKPGKDFSPTPTPTNGFSKFLTISPSELITWRLMIL
jgi:hypothetical protein